MGPESLFSGSALVPVDAQRRIKLPGFVLRTLAQRGDSPLLVLGWHEIDPCLVAHDEGHLRFLFADLERRRLAGDGSTARRGADRRSRRTFGAVAAEAIDPAGRVVLPEPLARRARISTAALIIGTGGSFEIWSPEVARAGRDRDLRELAAFAVAQRNPEARAMGR